MNVSRGISSAKPSKEVNQEFEGITLDQALVKQAELRGWIRSGGRSDTRERVKYGDYATSLFERKLGTGGYAAPPRTDSNSLEKQKAL